MKFAKTVLKSLSPLSFSRYHSTPRKEKESHDEYRERTWREHCHYDKKTGELYLPPMMLKNALSLAAAYNGEKIAGQGMKRWTEKFKSGVLVFNGPAIGVNLKEVEGETLYLPSDGKAGGGKRVLKTYPRVDDWQAVAAWHIMDDSITQDVFTRTLTQCGQFIGFGRFRPKNNGYYGRFEVVKVEWQDAR